MYESPIKVVYNDVVPEFESGVMRAIQKVDIFVEKDELIRALDYDRGQYEKGYADAKAENMQGKWINKWSSFFHADIPTCSICQCGTALKTNFCPNCGARMVEE